MPVYGSLFVSGSTTLAQCQALACQIYPSIQGCPQPCQAETQSQSQNCPINYSGSITQTRQKICPQNIWTDWQVQNTCTPNPPSCQVSTQTQTISCQTGYVGTITQVQSSTCPNPYAQPIWSGTWITTQNTCTKSVTNPTNVLSPVSPVSPLNLTPVSPTPTLTVTAPTIQDVPKSEATLTTSQTKSTASETPTQTPKSPFSLKTIPLALSLELFSKPMAQPNVFHDLNIGQELPNDIKMMQNIYMDLITNGSLFNPDQSDKLKRIASDAVELEQ